MIANSRFHRTSILQETILLLILFCPKIKDLSKQKIRMQYTLFGSIN